jgi:hypothetical protein
MLNENTGIPVAEVEAARWEAEGQQPNYDFASCQRLKKLTTHE